MVAARPGTGRAAAWLLTFLGVAFSAPSLPARESPAQLEGTLEEFVLGSDFTVLARVKKGFRPGDSSIAVEVDDVLLGAIPKRTLLVGSLPARELAARETVLVCGTWVGTKRSRCPAHLWRVRSDGALLEASGRAPQALGEETIDRPGSLARLLERLEQGRMQNPAAWLTSGAGIGLARIVGVSSDRGLIRVAPVRRLAGEEGHFPSALRWPLARCQFAPSVGDSLLLPLPLSEGDSLLEAPCLDRLSVTSFVRNPLGVSLADIHRIVEVSQGRLRVRPIHGVPLARLEDDR